MAFTAMVFFVAGWAAVTGAALGYTWNTVRVRSAGAAAVTSAGTLAIPERADVPRSYGRGLTLASWTGAACLGAAIVARTIAVQRPPYGTMWEYFLVFGFGITLVYLLFERRYGRGAMGSLGAVALASVAMLLTVSHLAFPSEVAPLVPALQNNQLLAIHVASMLVSYSALAVAFAAAVIYLVQGRGNRFDWLPASGFVETIQHRAVMIGFPILGLGIVLGAYWGHYAWGRYWAWDPKETTALASWLVFAGYLHARSLRDWRGARAATLVIIGFGTILFNIFFVNFVVSGLHSYAGG